MLSYDAVLADASRLPIAHRLQLIDALWDTLSPESLPPLARNGSPRFSVGRPSLIQALSRRYPGTKSRPTPCGGRRNSLPTRAIRYFPGARCDFDESFDWYLARSPVAAIGFVEAVDRALAGIAANPQRFARVDNVHRECSLLRYPSVSHHFPSRG